MQFWDHGWVQSALLLAVLGLLATLLRRAVPRLTRLGVPACILAGVLGLLLGPDGLGALPVDRDVLETIVYHGLAVVFIAIGLQSPPKGSTTSAGARSIVFAVPFVQTVQVVIGLGVVLALGGLHPGFGLMLALGFEQGPGQALSLGAAWEQVGMVDGAQVGLIVASIGFAWSIVAGIPLVAWGRARGYVHAGGGGPEPLAETVHTGVGGAPGALDGLTAQLSAVGGIYALTWLTCALISRLLAPWPDVAHTVWGFHFVVGAAIAIGARRVLGGEGALVPLDDGLLSRISGLAVDVMTTASLTAVQIGVLRSNLVPLLLLTTVGGVVTLVLCVALSRRAFPEAWFEHCVVWFGMSTGTLPMGLALLRVIDPDLRSPAPRSAVIGSAGAIVPAIPLVMVLMPAVVAAWPERWPVGGVVAIGACVAWMALLVGLWRLIGPLRFRPSPQEEARPASLTTTCKDSGASSCRRRRRVRRSCSRRSPTLCWRISRMCTSSSC